MRFFILIVSLLHVLSLATFAQQQSAKTQNKLPIVRTLRGGKARLTLGKTVRIVDLSDDVAGCLSVYDGAAPKPSRSDFTDYLRIVDKTQKNDYFYIVLLASGQGNCNVQGMCGAATDYSLIWLKLDQTLEVVDKKSATIEDCRGGISIAKSDFEGGTDGEPLIPKLRNNNLAIEYEANRYSENEDYKYFRLNYNAAEPEKGFVIVEEKREKN